jgi:hypothetical protein
VTGSVVSVVGDAVKVCEVVPVLVTVEKKLTVVFTAPETYEGRDDSTNLLFVPPPIPGRIVRFHDAGTAVSTG